MYVRRPEGTAYHLRLPMWLVGPIYSIMFSSLVRVRAKSSLYVFQILPKAQSTLSVIHINTIWGRQDVPHKFVNVKRLHLPDLF